MALILALLLTLSAFAADRGQGVEAARQAGIDDYDPARFHALLIGIDDYEQWPDLRCAAADVQAIGKVLNDDYGWPAGNIRTLTNRAATREAVLGALDGYRQLGDADSLLVYYAGHGWMDSDRNGYWIPADARRDKKFDYVSNARIVEEYFKKYRVKHLLVVADSCFAGAMLRAGEVTRPADWQLPAGFRKPSRWIMTSGDLHPVADDAGGHSPFAMRFLQELQYGDDPVFGVLDLYTYIRKGIDSEPLAQPLQTSQHMPGGEFIFARVGRREPPPQPAGPVAGQPWTVPEIGMEFVWVSALKCWVGKYEVTNGEYRKKEPGHDSKDYEGHSLKGDRQPVAYVNFHDATAYAAWLTERERNAGRLPPGAAYRLPTEKEWETFASCGDNRKSPWGNDWPPKYGNYHGGEGPGSWHKIDNYRDGHAVTCAVEQSGKNDWGLYGVGGNVWECTVSNDLGSGAFGAWRGASWFDNGLVYLLVSYRTGNATFRGYYVGFRLLLSPAGP